MMNDKPLSDYQAAKRLTKALNEIKATPFQVVAASTLLSVNGLDSALRFVQDCARLNKMREEGTLGQ